MKNDILKKVLNTVGILLMIGVIALTIPLNIPKLFGYQIYAVLTGSMEPAYPVGSVVYVRPVSALEVEIGDAITFTMGTETDNMMTHRVVSINEEEQTFITKGDSNGSNDPEPVNFDRVVGKPVFCIPMLANVSNLMQTTTGKAAFFIIFALAFICFIVADMLAISTSNTKSQAMEKKRKKWDRTVLIRIVAGAVILFAAGGLIMAGVEYKSGSDEYEELREMMWEDTEAPSNAGETEETPITDEAVWAKLAELAKQNEEVIGWIVFDELDIDYPIMQTDNDEYYLTHTFNGSENKAGSIFMEMKNSPDFLDYHTIIYGHNMKNLTMFGSLKKYRDEEFYAGNEYFTIYTADKVYRYQIFSVETVPALDEVYTIGFAPDQEYQDFLDRLVRRSWYDTGVSVTKEDRVITLSTCTASESTRFVVHGKVIETR